MVAISPVKRKKWTCEHTRFVARRRGREVIIKGNVQVSFLKKGPFVRPVPEPQTDIRTYELCYAQEAFLKVSYPEEMALVVYEELEMPEFVRVIRVKLPNDREFLIKSRRRDEK
jgi:hypothetical protein